jgi:hypothetical protein
LCSILLHRTVRLEFAAATIIGNFCYRTDRKKRPMSIPIRDNPVTSSPHQPSFRQNYHARERNPRPFLGEGTTRAKALPFSARHVAISTLHLLSLPPPLHTHSRGRYYYHPPHSRLPSRGTRQGSAHKELAWSAHPVTRSASSGRFSSFFLRVWFWCKIHRPPVTPFW